MFFRNLIKQTILCAIVFAAGALATAVYCNNKPESEPLEIDDEDIEMDKQAFWQTSHMHDYE